MPTLAALVRTLGTDLAPVRPAVPPPREVTAVHVSELADPTPYLSGGELLLTTGMCLSGRTAQARAYTTRLASRGVAALAIGLGPSHQRVPEALTEACEAVGLPLLVVPGPTPFLVVARTYWSLVAAAGQEQLASALVSHRELVRAAAGPNPVPTVVRTLAGAVAGWAAQLSAQGEVVEVWPRGRRASARKTSAEVARLRVAGPHSSATFPLGTDDVLLQPLTSRGRLTGFVAVGCPRPMNGPDRQLTLTACALLALQSEQHRRLVAGTRATRACVGRLLMAGFVDAARALAAELALPAIVPRMRPLVLAIDTGPGGEEVLDSLEMSVARERRHFPAVVEADRILILIEPCDAPAVAAAARPLLAGRVRAVLGTETDVAELHRQLPALNRTLAGVPAGTLRDLAGQGVAAAPTLEPLLAYRHADLVGTVAAYLRHRGQWERAAADLGVHRNTLRHRIGRAATLLDADLDDPDVASRLWLTLREDGLA
ncbi:PucR family transcriptional regulator [Streptomyces sp. NBC_01306]|uniref:PucR family transcriptional regulator n=1 Tax=Streptomyces sp. NBC_01306 TaxID=2903819 RepID=UPI00225051F6|nr:PucR family transcriptional regulator [Streptomyces sp. NBC_01306]MCX4728690.1 PucR family transcriptional regulator [Streptomyces sp. NBC_01306]MCX4729153.1 PucR family transcriptional regulator [Streptomyces sp. NBC_01306]